MNRRELIVKGIGAAICAGVTPPFLPALMRVSDYELWARNVCRSDPLEIARNPTPYFARLEMANARHKVETLEGGRPVWIDDPTLIVRGAA